MCPRAHALRQEKPLQRDAHTGQLESRCHSQKLEKANEQPWRSSATNKTTKQNMALHCRTSLMSDFGSRSPSWSWQALLNVPCKFWDYLSSNLLFPVIFQHLYSCRLSALSSFLSFFIFNLHSLQSFTHMSNSVLACVSHRNPTNKSIADGNLRKHTG